MLAMQLGFCVASASKWLGRQCHSGRVLYVDYELRRADLHARFAACREAMAISEEHFVDAVSLRTKRRSLPELLIQIGSRYDLVIVDCLFKALPRGTSEIDPVALSEFYCDLAAWSEQTDTAVVLIHHATKGQQADKKATDVGSGSGVLSRSVDAHIVVREHSTPGMAVIDLIFADYHPSHSSQYSEFGQCGPSATRFRLFAHLRT